MRAIGLNIRQKTMRSSSVIQVCIILALFFLSCGYYHYYDLMGDYECTKSNDPKLFLLRSDGLEIQVSGLISGLDVVVVNFFFENIGYDSIYVFPFHIKVGDDKNNYDLVSFYFNERRVNLKKGSQFYCIFGDKKYKLQLRYSVSDSNHEPVPWFEVNLNDFLRIDNDRSIEFDVLRFEKLP